MIDKVPLPGVNSRGNKPPVALVPVSAEDFSRRRMRTGWTVAAVIVAILGTAGYLYKRSVDPLHAQESLDAGTRLFKAARYNEAVLSLDRAIALNPRLADAYLMRGKAFVGKNDLDRAILDFTKVTELRPADPAGWIARGSDYLELNNFRAAIDDATHAIAANPKQAASYSLRGTAYRKNGNTQEALEDFKRAVELEPTAANYFERAATYQLIGEHRLAIADFDRVIEIIPDLAGAFFARAESRRAIGDQAGAQKDHRVGRILDGR